MNMRRVLVSTLIVGTMIGSSLFFVQQVRADDPKPAEKAADKTDDKTARPPMPADVTSEQRVSLPGRVLKYHVTVGSLPMKNAKGEHKADIFYIAYILDTGKSVAPGEQGRPITFAFNGGPGAASA
jgi:carboxypeptidase C (cathepsin A)